MADEKQTILVVEDEEDILALLHFNLVKVGYKVECATCGEEGLQKIDMARPDLLLLDLMLPGIDGLEICRRLRDDEATAGLPIIMLTAKGEEEDVVRGLELGADDYITKPFSNKVLLARIQAVFRRRSREKRQNGGEEIEVDQLRIHPGRNLVQVAGGNVDLTFTEFRVLVALVSRPGWVFTRYQIVNAVRGEDYAVTDRAVDVQIAGLRKKLGICGEYIETVRGVGYRFREDP
ncbi:MAG: DNA-binding response regulator [Desulfuromonas sp.]|nr:MAG: DNA-binding response regulator [Desulfuromonas sp.]